MGHEEMIRKSMPWFIFWMVVVFVILFSSCDPCQRLSRRCPPQVKDSIVYKEVLRYRDTTIYVTLPRDTVFIGPPELKISVVNGQIIMEKVCKSYGIITLYAWIETSQHYVYAYLNDTSYKVTIESSIRLSEYWHERVRTEKTVVEVKYIPAFYKFTFWFFIAVVVLTAGYVAIKLKIL